jgi:hypothetical protein
LRVDRRRFPREDGSSRGVPHFPDGGKGHPASWSRPRACLVSAQTANSQICSANARVDAPLRCMNTH